MRSSDYTNTRFYSEEETRRIAGEIEKAVTIPVNITFEFKHRVLDFSEMKKILETAERITVQNCGCKTEYQNCNAPKDVCLSLNETADELLQKDRSDARELNVDEALSVLQKSHEAGLVHMAYTMKGDGKPSIICSCCPCCCHTLGSLVRNGIHTEILTSKYITTHDKPKCIQCAKCVERCVFQARRMEEEKLIYDPSKCHGCGLCISTCPTKANSLVLREPQH